MKFRYNWLFYCHHSTGCKGSHELAFQFSDRSNRGDDEIPPRQPGCRQSHPHRRGLMNIAFSESRRPRV
ncbi:MAG TPA: hypothetical protein VER35_02550, partial [Candidatus Limnocylindrales bacterium]|nr:hypothetical protein [Candidatus Limnocylindrales bacterium]